uniref:Uncharacterized protein n=1 Tax=Arundo donax TaxID=35708 RepID=A0A0A9H3A5_ARUDO
MTNKGCQGQTSHWSQAGSRVNG